MSLFKIVEKKSPEYLIFFYGKTFDQINSFLKAIDNIKYKKKIRLIIFYSQYDLYKNPFKKYNLNLNFFNIDSSKNILDIFIKINKIIKKEKINSPNLKNTLSITEVIHSYDYALNFFIATSINNKIKLLCIKHGAYIFSGSAFTHDKGWSLKQNYISYLKNFIHSLKAYFLIQLATLRFRKIPPFKVMIFGIVNIKFFDFLISFGDISTIKKSFNHQNIFNVKPNINEFLKPEITSERKPVIYLISSGSFQRRNNKLMRDNKIIFKKLLNEYYKNFSENYSIIIIGKDREIKTLKKIFYLEKIISRSHAKISPHDRFIVPLCSGALIELAENNPNNLCIPFFIENQVHFKVRLPKSSKMITIKNNIHKNFAWSKAFDIVYKDTNLNEIWGLKNKKLTDEIISNVLLDNY